MVDRERRVPVRAKRNSGQERFYEPERYRRPMELLIVGAGSIGRWFAGSLDADVTFTDIQPDAAATAASQCDGRSVPLTDDISVTAVCIAVPMTTAEDAIANHAGKATDAVLDLSGAMTGPVSAMEEHAPDLERLSLHPLFAPENAPGRIAVVTDSTGPTTRAVLEGLDNAGNTLFETTATDHDRAMETVQARAHAAILSFALAAEAVDDPFGTPIYEELDHLVGEFLGGTPRVYADIQETFSGAEDVAEAARRIAEADHDTFERLYRDAGG